MNLKEHRSFGVDIILLMAVIFLISIGLISVYSASIYLAKAHFFDSLFFFKRQAYFALFGLFLMFLATNVNYQSYKNYAIPFFIISIVLLFLVWVPGIGGSIRGAKRWLRIGPWIFMPSIIAQVSITFCLADLLSSESLNINFKKPLLLIFLIVLLPSLIILFQPDIANSLIIIMLGSLILYFYGIDKKYIMIIYTLYTIPVVYLFISHWNFIKRLAAFINPWQDPLGNGYHIIQSLIALGSGGITGVGYNQGMQKLFYVPDIHTTFIISCIGEESGLIGILIIISCFILLLLRGFLIAIRAKDYFGKCLAFGIVIIIGLEVIINLFLVYGLFPVTGIELPFISYSSTNNLLKLYLIGILLNISYESKKYSSLSYRANICINFIHDRMRNFAESIEHNIYYKLLLFAVALLTIIGFAFSLIKLIMVK